MHVGIAETKVSNLGNRICLIATFLGLRQIDLQYLYSSCRVSSDDQKKRNLNRNENILLLLISGDNYQTAGSLRLRKNLCDMLPHSAHGN